MAKEQFSHVSLAALQPYRAALRDHAIYSSISSLDHVRLLMESHVFAVWDFMCLLKALQRTVTCVETFWLPRGDPATRRLINEIVTGEESDLLPSGRCISHFELYLEAMEEAGANTAPMKRFLSELENGCEVQAALERCNAPRGAQEFVLTTMEVVREGRPHALAASFSIGREDIIPTMFIELLGGLPKSNSFSLKTFIYYLERHIELDGDEHSGMAEKMLSSLCGDDPAKWRESADIAATALQARASLWNSVVKQIPVASPGNKTDLICPSDAEVAFAPESV